MTETTWQCCHCRLPHRGGHENVSHGFHETCLLVVDPKMYRRMLEKQDDQDQPVTS